MTGESDLALLGTPIPVSVGLRQALGRHAEIAATAGWATSGLELRLGPADDDQRVPWVVSVGARTGEVSAASVPSYEGRVRFEAYPAAAASGSGALRFALSAGASGGVFSRAFPLTGVEEPTGDVFLSRPSVNILRPELRMEAGLGVHGRTASVGYVVAIAPWFLVAHGDAKSSDSAYTVQDLASSVGVALVFGLSFGSDHGASAAPTTWQR